MEPKLTQTKNSSLTDWRARFAALLTLLITGSFWLGSRYPALDRKSLTGGETEISGLGFETLIPTAASDVFFQRLWAVTLNWIFTNLYGMTFGILLGAAVMTLVKSWGMTSKPQAHRDTLYGVLMGSPLGVCVNCATPISFGVLASGGRLNTALGLMFSSPTLNPIVLTMLFGLFPFYLAMTKVTLTLIFLLLILPSLTKFVPQQNLQDLQADAPKPDCPAEVFPGGLWESLRWLFGTFSRSLWYLAIRTVPLMFVAGTLGALVVTVLPFSALAEWASFGSRPLNVLAMVMFAIIGVFLPVPMTFDLVLTAILMQAGLPIKFVAVLLFSLGVFSVYPFLLLGQRLSFKFSGIVASFLVGMAMLSGVIGQGCHYWELRQEREELFALLKSGQISPWADRQRVKEGEPADKLLPELLANALEWEQNARHESITVERRKLKVDDRTSKLSFERISGKEIGLDETDSLTFMAFWDPWWFRGIAAGDVHNDGRTDLVIAGDLGFGLYAQRGPGDYVRQNIPVPILDQAYVASVALVDINNDGWLDVFFSTSNQGNFLLTNDGGRFPVTSLSRLPNNPDAMMTATAGFGDVDRDGDLDVVLGNWAPTPPPPPGEEGLLKDALLINNLGSFETSLLPGIPGETLSLLLTDFDSDRDLDLIVGNDRWAPDSYYLGDGSGGFDLLSKSDKIIPHSTRQTMSVTSGDINNDLVPEIYLAAVGLPNRQNHSVEEVCEQFSDADERKRCSQRVRAKRASIARRRGRELCQSLDTRFLRASCGLTRLLRKSMRNLDLTTFARLPEEWDSLKVYTKYAAKNLAKNPENLEEWRKRLFEADTLEQVHGAVLLEKVDDRFVDRAKELNVWECGWAWTSKFVDLDNDSWQDLFVVNNSSQEGESYHHLFRNQSGTNFKDIAQDVGLKSSLWAPSYTTLDIDDDGDLDIVQVPRLGPIIVAKNRIAGNHSISFELRDFLGNRFGIGSRIIVHHQQGAQMLELQASGGFVSFDAPIAHFGLGSISTVDKVEIHWSTGETSVLTQKFQAGYRYRLTRSLISD